MLRNSPLVVALVLSLPAVSQAHFLWVTVRGEGGAETVDLVFEESIRPGNGEYLDPIVKRGKTWVQTPGDKEARALELEETKEKGKRWLSGRLPVEGPYRVESYAKWGVYRYGKTDTLLHYYAQHVEADTQKEAQALGASKKLDLNMQVTPGENGAQVRVLWNGEPAGEAKLYVRGPKGARQNLITDKNGTATFAVEDPGLYLLRTGLLEKESGEFEGKEYTEVRHNATLTTRLPRGE